MGQNVTHCNADSPECRDCLVDLGEERVILKERRWDDTGVEFVDCEALKPLNGQWYRRQDQACVGEIENGYVIWHSHWKSVPPISRLLPVGDNGVILDMGGQAYFGEMSFHAQASITWSDGEIWLRK
mmetsp:Transcript_4912/g.11473  ORF Transcript_4912/g.11473 Transcript_4912/m.11473 type:complete len:127 (+) Transcript_4912:22-402(+)